MVRRFSPTMVLNPTDVRRLRKRLWTEQKKMQKIAESVWDYTKIGHKIAKSIAPVYTGTTLKATKFTINKGAKQGQIYVDENVLKTNNSTRNKKFNYVKYMHEHNGNMGRGIKITSGDPQFMWTTRDYLLKEMNKNIKIQLSKR